MHTADGKVWAYRAAFAAVVGVLGAMPAAAAPLRVLVLDSSRTPNDFSTSAGYNAARNDLLSPANFGPGGVVPQSVGSITAVPTLTTAALGAADVVVLSDLTTLPSDAENSALSAFLNAGGGLLVADNNAAALLQPILGVTPGGSSTSGVGLISNGASPLVSGPFGAGTVGSQVATGFAKSFAPGGLTGAGTEALTNDAGILAASFVPAGGGRVAAFNDEEMFASAGFVGGDAHFDRQSEQLFLNSFAFVIPAPEPSTCLIAAPGVALFCLRRQRRAARTPRHGAAR